MSIEFDDHQYEKVGHKSGYICECLPIRESVLSLLMSHLS